MSGEFPKNRPSEGGEPKDQNDSSNSGQRLPDLGDGSIGNEQIERTRPVEGGDSRPEPKERVIGDERTVPSEAARTDSTPFLYERFTSDELRELADEVDAVAASERQLLKDREKRGGTTAESVVSEGFSSHNVECAARLAVTAAVRSAVTDHERAARDAGEEPNEVSIEGYQVVNTVQDAVSGPRALYVKALDNDPQGNAASDLAGAHAIVGNAVDYTFQTMDELRTARVDTTKLGDAPLPAEDRRPIDAETAHTRYMGDELAASQLLAPRQFWADPPRL